MPSQYATHPITISGFTGAMFCVLVFFQTHAQRIPFFFYFGGPHLLGLLDSTAPMDPDALIKGGAALAAGLVLHAMAQPKQPAKNRKGCKYDGKVCASLD